jgi:FKBP-type peptidyl-prolyl cis-trans isomerase
MQKTIISIVMLLCLGSAVSVAQAQGPAPTSPIKLETDEQKTFYTLGLLLGNNVKVFDLKPEELAIVKAGMTDAVTGATPQVDIDTFGPKVNEMAKKRASAVSEDAKRKGQEFADKVALEKDATKTASGIVIRTITPGTGASPTAADVVRVHYEGKLIDGTIFDSSIKRNEPAEFPLGAVVPCWTEALQLMKKGGRSQVVCPAALAYGDRGSPPDIPPGSTLSFEVELLDFHKP